MKIAIVSILVILISGYYTIKKVLRESDAYLFRLRFLEGEIVEMDGEIPPRIIYPFKDIAKRYQVTGLITVRKESRMEFSSSIKDSNRQRFRNIFFMKY